MLSKIFTIEKKSVVVVALAAAFVLSVALLCGCASQSASSGEESASQPAEASSIDVSSWKTVGDALATQTASVSSSWDDKHYVNVFQAGDSYFRIVADVDAEANKKAEAVDWSRDDTDKQIEEAFSGLALTSAEDITSDKISQTELDGFVGKTGKDVVDGGFKFADYYMYGGDETGAQFDRGFFSYMFVFDVPVSVSEGDADVNDGGAAVQDAVVKSVEFLNAANDATDVTKL